jgi:hypothetical protein
MSPAHRILAAETPDEPHRRDEPVEDDAQEDSRIDSSQRLARRHPDPVDGHQDPRREESRNEQEDADDQGPRARAGAADDGGPESDRAEDASDQQPELPELGGVGIPRHRWNPPKPGASVKLVLRAPVPIADQRLLVRLLEKVMSYLAYQQTMPLSDWPYGAAIALVLLAMTSAGVVVYLRLLESGRLGVVFR